MFRDTMQSSSLYKDSDKWIEERNSWDDTMGSFPYHPCSWKGTLPGPAVSLPVGSKDMMNLGLVNGGTYVMGRLIMIRLLACLCSPFDPLGLVETTKGFFCFALHPFWLTPPSSPW
jgi:hypothetical protein